MAGVVARLAVHGWLMLAAASALPLGACAIAGERPANAQPQPMNPRMSGDLITHDPVIIRQDDTYYQFATGGEYVSVKTSPDLLRWTDAGSALPAMPDWTKDAVPGAQGMWAPDISFVNGQYRLYYSVSSFGSNRSAIGLATSPTLDRDDPDYKWTDRGRVVQSMPNDDYNAIDPNLVVDREGRQWLSFGSFWSGIKLVALNPETGKPAAGAPLHAIASRPAPDGGPAPVEAPFIFERDGWYYLLVSYDYCCKGVNSTYYTVIARSRDITGPYLGRDGSSMMHGGGTILLRADLQEKERFRGPGHPGAFTDRDGTTYVTYHAYDREQDGAPKLRLAPLVWDADGWPTALK
ncbi:arabinan endo-1,5-alpha-L-arabinosidase [Croceicoccus hydrothermalis]|uniref:arabinan endo-1,5-alpha-L-arabinosidase n=1 Tax=Croceicoccus hydrothermalis TaxID=2867964 RepID=UPI001EFBD524|nr:arabinan endo-1,5-alpha-L-arabinosidase [Croceicoccus hydrothermalis]